MLQRKLKYFEGIISPTLVNTEKSYYETFSTYETYHKVNKAKDTKDILKYQKQRNYVVESNNPSKQEHFDSLDPFLDLKSFWKSCKPFFF